MHDQWMTASIVTLLIVGGAFLGRLLLWWERSPYHPESQEAQAKREGELAERAQQIEEWLQAGRRRQIITQNLQGPGPLQELLSWLKGAPFTQVKAEETLIGDERKRLNRWFWAVFAYLVVLGTASGWCTLTTTTLSLSSFFVAGLFGSCVAAFRSCLDRRANGFEDKYGNVSPDPKTTKERFADGMITWFFGRPFLGAALGVATYLALQGEVFGADLTLTKLQTNPSKVMFYTWVVGLFAKTVLDLLLDLTKKIFP